MFKIIFLFTFLGPYIGGVATLIFTFVHITFPLDGDDKAIFVIGKLVTNVLCAPLMGVFGYPFAFIKAGIPATFSGIVYWVVLKYLHENLEPVKRILIGGTIGFFVSLIYFFLFPMSFLLPHTNEGGIDSWTWFMTCVGAISSAFCASFLTNNE